jgi:glycosyltransferase involved in cell wall biosynthesis
VYRLSWVLPAHNEVENISRSIVAAEAVLNVLVRSGQLIDWEVVVVDDGSADGTAAAVAAHQDVRVRLVRHGANQGYGAALRTGFRAARGNLVFFTDADLQFDAQEVVRLMPWVGQYDIVAGYRAPRQDPWVRRVNAKAWGLALYGVFGLDVQDVNCAFKLFHKHVLDAVSIRSEGAFVNAEILVQAQQRGFRIRQVPVSHFAREAGTQSGAQPRVVLRALKELARFYRGDWGTNAPFSDAAASPPVGPWTSEPRAASVASTIR